MTKQERVAMGHRLRQQRTLLGLTREEFAELADIRPAITARSRWGPHRCPLTR